MTNRINHSRRRFLRSSCYAAVSGSLAGTLGSLQRAHAAATGSDYKALVCIYLDGGVDSINLLVPTGASEYGIYNVARSGVYNAGCNPGGMAIAQNTLLSLSGAQAGLHPAMERMQQLFNSGKLASVANVGSLLEPITKAQVIAGTAKLPPQLFSHSDQSDQWHLAYANSLEPKGWFGRVADMVGSMNPSPSPSMSISIAGNNIMQVGNTVVPYGIETGGPKGLDLGYDTDGELDARARVAAIMAASNHLLGIEHSAIRSRAIDNFDLISAALTDQENNNPITTPFPANIYLGDQLKMVARSIAIRESIGACRQTFFVRLSGWDTHSNQLQEFPPLVQTLSDAIGAFYNATVELGVADNVSTFTMSEFNRTVNSNGEGTDHGWGDITSLWAVQ